MVFWPEVMHYGRRVPEFVRKNLKTGRRNTISDKMPDQKTILADIIFYGDMSPKFKLTNNKIAVDL